MPASPRHTLWIAVVALTLFGPLALSPLSAQTSDTFTNTKIFDLKNRDNVEAYGQRASESYQLGLEYAATVQRLAREDERSPREEKKLQKAYRRAVRHLMSAVEEQPTWIEPWMTLGAIHYQMKDWGDARAAYRTVLEADPENADAAAYLETVEYYLGQAAERTAGLADEGG